MKLSSKMHRQIEIKIRRSLANEPTRSETTSLPPVSPGKPATQETTSDR